MTKEELREKRNRAIESLKNIEAILGLDELYIDELEKENAELRTQIEKMKCCIVSWCEGCKRLPKLYKEMFNYGDKRKNNRNRV